METDCGATWHDSFLKACPSRQVLDMLADKWALLAICALTDGPMRFGELRRRLDGISQKVLTQTLRTLERDGLLHRRVYPTTPPKVEYSLADLGRSVLVLTAQLRTWAEENTDAVEAARAAYDTRELVAV
ncbi:winged helix-turn-helix transcriptional regulator [Longispora urticae]